MKKTTKNIIIALAVLVVLGAAAAALILTSPAADPEESSSSSVSSETLDKLIDKDIADVQKVAIKNSESGEVLTLVPIKSSADSEANDAFTVEGWENEDVLTSNVMTLAKAFYSITPTKELGAVEDLAEYGLSGSGAYEATVTYTDGSTDTVLVGSEAGETYGWYILYNDSVYIAPLSTEDVEGNETTLTPELESLHLSGTNYPEEIQLNTSDDELLLYEITEPVYAGASSTRIDSLLEQLQNVTASGVVAVQATEEDLEKHGLDEPSAIAEFELNNEKHTLRLGDRTEGIYSLMVDDNKTIYLIDEASVDSWANASVFEMRDGFIRLPNIKSVEKLSVEADDGTDVYTVERTLDEERSTETSPYYDITKVTLDGKEIDYDNYQPFYQMCLSVSVLNEEIREPQGEPALTLRYTYFDGREEVVSFYKDASADRRYIATLNGEVSGIVRSTDVEKILEAKPVLAQNQPVVAEDEE